MAHIFISYSSEDREIATRLRDRLKSEKFDVWMDTELQPGDNWDPMIDTYLRQSSVVIVLISSKSLASHWVTYEWSVASALGIRIFPVRVEDISIRSIHKKLEQFQILDCIGLDTFALENLIRVLKRSPYLLDAARNAANRDILRNLRDELTERVKNNPEMINEVLPALRDDNERVREIAAYIAGEVKAKSYVNDLLSLASDDSAILRSEAVEALGKIGEAEAIPILIRSLYDVESMVRYEAAQALGIIKGASAVDELIDLLKDEVALVRYACVEALGRIGDVRSVEALILMLKDNYIGYGNLTVAEGAAQALTRIGEVKGLKAAREWRQQNPKPDPFSGYRT